MLLSIGMIVKNEEKNLRKCLEGLKPILEQVDSELIIADTGSTDNTIKIAGEFTNYVYSIKWEGDFAKARNTTLNRSRGKWYMFIDADETFVDTADLIEFFNSGEYKEYKSAFYNVHNLMSKAGGGAVSRAHRMVRREKDIKFSGKIHEAITFKPPTKELKSWVEHWGYYFENGEDGEKEREAKHQRNLAPLLEGYEKDPSDIKILVHLIKQYEFNHESDKALELLGKGHPLFEIDGPHFCFCKYHMIKNLIILNKSEEALEEVENFFNNAKKKYSSSIDIKIMQGGALASLGRADEAMLARKEAMELIEQYNRGELDTTDMIVNVSSGVLPVTKDNLYGLIFQYYLKIDDFDGAIKYAAIKEFTDKEVLGAYASFAIKEKDYDKSLTLYNHLLTNYGYDSAEYKTAVEEMENCAAIAGVLPDIAAILADSSIDDDYITLQKLRHQYHTDNSEAAATLDKLINSPTVTDPLYADIIAYAIKMDADFTPFAERAEISGFPKMAAILERNNKDIVDLVEKYMNSGVRQTARRSVKASKIMATLAQWLVDRAVDDEAKTAALERYVHLFNEHMQTIFKENIIDDVLIDAAPEQARFTFYASRAYEKRQAGDLLGFVQNLKIAFQKDPSMKDLVSMIIRRFQEEEGFESPVETKPEDQTSMTHEVMEEEVAGDDVTNMADDVDSGEANPQEQLDNEIMALKNAIYALISSGKIEKAAGILAAYEQINPTDPDIAAIKATIQEGGY